jgi:hypothetical protein
MLDDQSHAPVRYLSRADAAKYISSRYGFSCSPQWLAKLAVGDAGPIFKKAGRIPVYRPADLDSWATQRVVGLSPEGGETEQ